MIPHRVRVSEQATARLKYLKSKTGMTPNILSRFAFLLSARDLRRVTRGTADLAGQEFLAPTLFGEHQELYDLLLVRYVDQTKDDREPAAIIANHIENGLHQDGACARSRRHCRVEMSRGVADPAYWYRPRPPVGSRLRRMEFRRC